MLRQISDRLQLDRPLAYALATRCWQAISGPITIVLLIRSLSLPEQGVYYAIVGIVSIQAYFELGLLNVLVSHAGHEAAAMGQARATGDGANHAGWLRAATRMRDLIRSSTRWFFVASVLFAFCALAFGWFTLQASSVAWQLPLLAIVPLAAVSVALAPALSILEGAGFRDLAYRFRFFQIVAGSVGVWAALATGWQLWALVVASAVQALMAIVVVFIVKRPYFAEFRRLPPTPSDFVWSRDVVPFQWRVALITAAFHFATQFFTIIVLKFHSDAEAAPLGMTLSVTSAIQMMALAWVQTKYPLISAKHGAGQREAAGTLWRHTAIVSTGLLIAASVAFTLIVASLPLFQLGLEKRFIAPWQVVVLSIGCLANHLTALEGFYVLSRRAKPLLGASLIGATATGIAVWWGGYAYATDGVVIGYALGMAGVLLPAHSWAYYRFRQRADVS